MNLLYKVLYKLIASHLPESGVKWGGGTYWRLFTEV